MPPGVFSAFASPIQKAIEERGFSAPTEPQSRAIPLIIEGKNVLLIAPTATGKTEAAFLPIINALIETERVPGIKVLYITPLKALNRDMLERLQWWCKRLDLRLGVRHGDTSSSEREAQAVVPPDILITTPETLQAILPGKLMRRHLASVRWVIVDEVHELAIDKRGSQLALALERLRDLKNGDFQIIGLSATIGTPDKVAQFLVGSKRACEIIIVPVARAMQVAVYYPKADSRDYKLAEELYTYPEVAARLRLMKELIEAHKSTLLFTNTRSIAEILGSRFRVWDLNLAPHYDPASPVRALPVGVHHGSLSKLSRITVERGLKEGTLHGIICTSSLELGIDIGRLDFVIQYNSPRQVTRLLQRIGRSGHKIGGIAHGAIVVQDSDDALEALVIARRSLAEDLEPADIHRKPLDVLAHQLAGLLLAKRRWSFDEALSLLKRAYPYQDLEEHELVSVLHYMHARMPRLVWFSAEDRAFLRPQRIKALYSYYFEHLSMIPEERHYLVITEDDNPVGVLDEAFVAEYGTPGNKFIEGGRVWKILHVYGDRIYVKPEEDPTGAIPSWAGEEIPVPFAIADEVGKIRGRVEAELRGGNTAERIGTELITRYPTSMETITRALNEVIEHVKRGYPVPTDELLTLERWKEYIILHCSFGLLANRTLAMILASVLSDQIGAPVGVQQDPYRIMLKIEDTELALDDVKELILELAAKPIEKLALNALVRSRLFKVRFIHVARRFGALATDASLSDFDLDNVIRSFEGSAVFEEALREAQNSDVDIPLTVQLFKQLAAGELTITVLKAEEASPIAGIAEVITRGYELIPPERMHRVILSYVKARLLDESLTFVCTNCWSYTAVRRIHEIEPASLHCPVCESKMIGALKADEREVRRVVGKDQGKRKKASRLANEAKKAAELIATSGTAALLALAGKGLTIDDASKILNREREVNNHLLELIIESEKEVLKHRFYRYKKETIV
ncbi:MAG: DEAD/DEAH box helicase [Methanophagales archaeon ANME-1-THS]|nr:MAG: DEAD/DEAH box helicase [Methanophagales archaeon ANME-1-THS]